jgi:hypothetical protein
MKPLYTQTEFNNAKSRQLLPLLCIQCGSVFYKRKHHILENTLSPERGPMDFCSTKCYGAHRQQATPITPCAQCGTPVRRLITQRVKFKHVFCGHSCSAQYNNAHKIKGTRVSKLEKWLAVELPKRYPKLEFHFNRKDAINGELDIYIPSLKLAFELNGIFHYEPIYGPDKLASIQTNDTRKMQACLERGIELCIVDTSTQLYFKEATAMRFMGIIVDVIDLALKHAPRVELG